MVSISQICIIITIIAYLAVMIGVGFYFSKKNESVGDFYLGGRKMGPIVTAMSAEASDMSSWLLMGIPGLVYLSGLADAGWTIIGLAIGTYLNWLLVSSRIRRYTHRVKALTIPEFFSKRYGDSKNILTCVAAVIIVIFFIPYTASGFAACGKLFRTLFGADYLTAMLLSAVIIVLYCTMGGFRAVSTTDLIQSIAMSAALIVLVAFGIYTAGGVSVILDNVSNLSGYLSMTSTHDVATGDASPYTFFTICSTLAWGLGYFGMPHILLRFMAIRDEQELTTSRRIACIWVVISMAVACLIGVVGLSLSKSGIIETLEGSDSETVVVKMSSLLAEHGIIAALFAGLILAGILACTMSTADSQLLAAASSISKNLIQDFGGKKLSDKASVRIARITVLIIAIIAICLAYNPDSSVFSIVSFAWAGFGAAFGPTVLLALFWRRSNKNGALAGMIAGGVMIFVWKYGIANLGGVFAIYELLPGFVFGLLVNVIVSLATPAPDAEVTCIFDEIKSVK